jgi:hypothetical protein
MLMALEDSAEDVRLVLEGVTAVTQRERFTPCQRERFHHNSEVCWRQIDMLLRLGHSALEARLDDTTDTSQWQSQCRARDT